jgi:GNAT superfamily N-acetyltransferase
MIAEDIQITILPVPVATVFDAPNSEALLQAYAEDCLVPDAKPQRAMYEAMERVGALQCFAAYSGRLLVGIVSVVSAVVPHLGKRIATIESVFVDPAYRSTGAGDSLLEAAEHYATGVKCLAITGSPRIDSAFEKVLSRRPGYQRTHSMFTRWLA